MIGSKAYNLIRLRDVFNVPVPEFIILEFSEVIITGKTISLNPIIIKEIHQKIIDMGWDKVSFRTSALQEDGKRHSFAGMYKSFIDVKYSKKSLKKYIVACYESTLNDNVIQYANKHNLELNVGGSVIIQKMFYGKQCGVVFSEDGKGNIHIAYTKSWKNTVVDNESAIEVKIPKWNIDNHKSSKHFIRLAQQVSTIEQSEGFPVDIEWAYDGKSLAFLQLRPLTTLDYSYNLIWDSTNISENYPGITLPLTYSFIRSAYSTVYPEFLKLIGFNKKELSRKSDIFDNMLGYLNGHIYYRISNWYKLVDLIPGKNNQIFFESMLNPVNKLGESNKKTKIDPKSLLAIMRFIWILLNSPRLSKKFKSLFSQRYNSLKRANPNNVSAEVVYNDIQKFKFNLLELWAIPVLNDIHTMIFHGLLKKRLLKKYNNKEYINVLQGLTNQYSLRPLKSLSNLGIYINNAMEENNVDTIEKLRKTESWDACVNEVQNYIKEYSARTPDELKLESVPISEDVTNIMTLALNSRNKKYVVRKTSSQNILSKKDLITYYLSVRTRRSIDLREQFRFNRAQVFRMVSEAYLSIGHRFFDEGIIEEPRDIYYLYEREIDDIINGHAWEYNARRLIKNRKEKFNEYYSKKMSLLVTGNGKIATSHLKNKERNKVEIKMGVGVSSGLVSGSVVVAKIFNPRLDVKNKILVVTHIDPGWTLLFAQASGVITERGNALSHVAIVARELGIPAIVGVKDATNIYSDNDFVTIDGTTGEIIIGKHKTNN